MEGRELTWNRLNLCRVSQALGADCSHKSSCVRTKLCADKVIAFVEVIFVEDTECLISCPYWWLLASARKQPCQRALPLHQEFRKT